MAFTLFSPLFQIFNLIKTHSKPTKLTIFKPVWKLYLDLKLHPIWHLANSHTIILLYYLTLLQGRRRGGDKLEKGFASFCSIGGKGSLQSYLRLILWINPDFLPVPKIQLFKKRKPPEKCSNAEAILNCALSGKLKSLTSLQNRILTKQGNDWPPETRRCCKRKPCSAMKYHAIPCNTVQYHKIP